MVAFIEMANRASWTVHVDGLGMTPLGEFDVDGRAYGSSWRGLSGASH